MLTIFSVSHIDIFNRGSVLPNIIGMERIVSDPMGYFMEKHPHRSNELVVCFRRLLGMHEGLVIASSLCLSCQLCLWA